MSVDHVITFKVKYLLCTEKYLHAYYRTTVADNGIAIGLLLQLGRVKGGIVFAGSFS